MLDLAEIVREVGPASLKRDGERLLPSHEKALQDIVHCRTAALGGEVFWCDHCQTYLYRDHSCGNRHCPTCGQDRADRWRDKQLQKRLPVPYFMVTFTLPHPLKPLVRSHQKLLSRLLFRCSAEALQALARNPTWLGGQIGMRGALHTWTRDMSYHVHVHDLVPGGAIDPISGDWRPAHPKFLVPGSALRKVFRGKFRDALQTAAPDLFAQIPPTTWTKDWSVHGTAVGDGRTALKYLTPSVSRVARSNRRLVSMQDGIVTFSYQPHKKGWQTMTLSALQFLRRFLQHVLPKGFQKVRCYGFLHPRARAAFTALKQRLDDAILAPRHWPSPLETDGATQQNGMQHTPARPGVCPHCGKPLRYGGRGLRLRLAPERLTLPRGPPEHAGKKAS